MAIKKSELYSKLWAGCDQLRGSMDASQYKDYVLVLLFMKYVSDKYEGQKDALLEVPKGGSFSDMVALIGDKEIGDKFNKIIAKLAGANNLKGVIDVANFNDEDKLGKAKDMVDRLSKLIAIFKDIDFGKNRADGDDLLGDAYEYLMRNFATESGKSKGQFYTPAEVSRIMAKVIGVGNASDARQTIYDPTCGSGSLLLKAHDEAKGATGLDLAIYGQEMDNATKALAHMNMILHDCPTAEIWQDNTLSTPHFKEKDELKTFDFVVANPPFSTKAWSNGFNPEQDEFHRFEFGIPPKKNGDYAFLLHILASLKSTGKGAVILPHGVLFRGGAEATIRREVVRRGYIKGIIGLPANLFYGTGIPACIIVLDKENVAARKGIFMIDASKGFIKDGNKNRLRAQDIHKIVDTFTRQIEIPKYSRMVPLAEITDAKNDYNLNLPRYIDSTEPEDLQDIDGHLRGGIPERDIDALEGYWSVMAGVRNVLFEGVGRPGYCQLKVSQAEIKSAVLNHVEFTAFKASVTKLFDKWKTVNRPKMVALAKGAKPKEFIELLSEDLLVTFEKTKLIDAYDMYQHLMDYWAETMQDDCYLISADGWKAEVTRVLVKNNKGKEVDKGWTCDLVPKGLVVARYFAKEQENITKLETEIESLTAQMTELEEEHGGDGGALDLVKVNKSSVSAELKKLKDDPESQEEVGILEAWLKCYENEAANKKALKEAEADLDSKLLDKYRKLTADDIKTLVVDDKWLSAIDADVQSELDHVSQTLAGRVRQLAERYATPLPKLTDEVEALSDKVAEHLKNMGAVWK